jgi:hypothetical protein
MKRTQTLSHCEERSDEAIQQQYGNLDCFAEPVIGPRDFARARWLAMTTRPDSRMRGNERKQQR